MTRLLQRKSDIIDTAEPDTTVPAGIRARRLADGGPASEAGVRQWSHGLDWPAVFWLVAIHVGALAAPVSNVFGWACSLARSE